MRSLLWSPYLALLSALGAFAEPIDAPRNVSIQSIENRSPNCNFKVRFNNEPGQNSTLALSYTKSPFEGLSALENHSRTCHLILDILLPPGNHTVAIREAQFEGIRIHEDDGQTAIIDTKAVWSETTGWVCSPVAFKRRYQLTRLGIIRTNSHSKWHSRFSRVDVQPNSILRGVQV
jgi:hypothetical protein